MQWQYKKKKKNRDLIICDVYNNINIKIFPVSFEA